MGMTAKGRALYALMEERGYSRGLVHVTVALLDRTDEALDDMIVFVADGCPTEAELLDRLASSCDGADVGNFLKVLRGS